ncbi:MULTISPECIES: hypothetical protein [Streptomyces]|uniref:Secreted protein n=1 Tax=Streptomyces griseus subsp. griseus (strain JCM 4626 / CBS 651.72 / NBRC 13350 / KCC S-0626 / ISP 5235) TaxID=455632 RepID=B1VZJ0_STRGG|nr:hypothetical protein [Streptomyces griseus]MYR13959.1 hypothetical protein [Streptomyces sp. SID724]MBW3707798.1 hypothetical protein [Streptomyces griseus]NEB51474.1 hypothetical protein [Streptomyces griseus]SEE57393.1 hypothetical protein SAMN04490359_4188 [Streptomyces griseus]SQA24864.1 Uncharacterised protein [Streptomyces griseus]
MNANQNSFQARTARHAAGVLAALVMTGLALTVAAVHDAPEAGPAGATVVLANNAGPATPPVKP